MTKQLFDLRLVHWAITGRCNYRCRHCFMSAPEAQFGELSYEQILRIVQELADCGVEIVSLTGGEPLVRRDFLEIVDALCERNIRIAGILSNGALVSKELLTALDRRGIHPEFIMSYDGPGWHDWLRGISGAEAAVDRAFLLCREMGFSTGAEITLHRGNMHLLRETVNHLRDVGCRCLKAGPVANVGEWQKNGEGQTLSVEELYRLYLDYIPHYYEDGMPLQVILGGFFSADPRKPKQWIVPNYHTAADPAQCPVCDHARKIMYISPEGRVLPCMGLSCAEMEKRFPLVFEAGLAKCLTDPNYLGFINTRADEILWHNPECKRCIWQEWCLGGCRARGLDDSAQSDPLHRDPYCCALYRGGWIGRLAKLMLKICPETESPVLKDKKFMRTMK